MRKVRIATAPLKSILLATIAIVITIAIYAPGLHGPFLLDDIGNLQPVQRWLDGSLGSLNTLLDNRSGPGGRPLSMMTFMLDAIREGSLESVAFKTTNLVIHLIGGGLAALVSLQVFRRTLRDETLARSGATIVALAWLWMPIQASTVLYIVQRMAELAAVFTFASLALYLHARERILRGDGRATWLMWFGVPALAALAALSKENGILALPLTGVLELCLFSPRERRPQERVFLALTTLLPILTSIAFLTLRPDWLLGGYASRDFSLAERLLTEPRVLWSYLQTSYFPFGPRMGLFHDNLLISTGITEPWTTLPALLGWVVLAILAVRFRTRFPLLPLGVFGYLVGMSLESGPIALEIYFEHRNYGPLLFSLVAVVGLVIDLLKHARLRMSIRRLMMISTIAWLMLYALGTWLTARTWRDEKTFYATQYAYNPTSPRLLSSLAGRAMTNGDLSSALRFIQAGEQASPPSERPNATLWRFMAYCETAGEAVPTTLYDELDERAQGRITTFTMVGWDLLADRLHRGCDGVDRSRIVAAGERWLNETPQPAASQPVWRTRYNLGRILADTGDISGAEELVHRAWVDSQHNNGIGVLLFQLNASLGNLAACREVLRSLEIAYGKGDRQIDAAVETFRHAFASGSSGGRQR